MFAPPNSTSRPRLSLGRLIISTLSLGILVYIICCIFFYLAQNSLEYPREFTDSDIPLAQAIQEAKVKGLVPWRMTTPGAQFPQGFVATDFDQPHPRGTIVVFHGNGAWVIKHTAYVDAFARRGFRAFLYEYPGYGGRPGFPREKTIVPDGRALIRSLAKGGYGPIYVWGESLGSGVAAAVCADRNLPVQGLALVTPWDSIANVGYYRYPFLPVRWLAKDKYDSIANLAHFRHPICVIRSSLDEVIPARLTLDLYDHLPPPKKLIVQEGYHHGNWPTQPQLTWWDDVLDFIALPRVKALSANPAAPGGASVTAKVPGA
jgi:pimeloyl-ACP methyl ester carboxylesterase